MRASNISVVVSRRRGTAGFVAGACVATLVAGGGVAIAAIPSSSTGTYAACVDRDSGDMRMIDRQKGQKCRQKREKTVTWSKGWTYRGAWAAGTAYRVGDVATAGGSSYLAKTKSVGATPASNPNVWGVLAAGGGVGAQGPTGPQGPKGDTGATGAQGIQGPAGPVTIQYVVGSAVSVPSQPNTTGFPAWCPEGLHAVSGQLFMTGTSSDVSIRESYANDSADADSVPDDGWYFYVNNQSGGSITATPGVVCSSVSSYS